MNEVVVKNKWGSLLKRLLLVIGLVDAVYLTYIKFASDKAICDTGCDIVNSSVYSEVLGIPVAIFGVIAYLFLLGLEFFIAKIPEFSNRLELAAFAISLFGFLYSVYLTYLELFIIHAICPYCVISAVVITIVMIINLMTILNQPLD